MVNPMDRMPKDSDYHKAGFSLMQEMNAFVDSFSGVEPTFGEIYDKAVSLFPDVNKFYEEFKTMFDVYELCRISNRNLEELFDEMKRALYPDAKIKLTISKRVRVGYFYGNRHTGFHIKTPYSWFTLLHEMWHILLNLRHFHDDERMAFLVPAGCYYFVKHHRGKSWSGTRYHQTKLV